MEISKEKTQYHEFLFRFSTGGNFQEVLEFCRVINQQYGWKEFKYEIAIKAWAFSKPEILSRLKQRFPELRIDPILASFVEELSQQIDLQEKQRLLAQAVKLKEVSNLEVSGLKLPLYNYQKLGVEFLIASGGRAMLNDDMGIGKTAQALGFIAHNKVKKTLVICPASVKYAWENEVSKWTRLKALVIDRKFGDSSAQKLMDKMDKYDIFIVNFDLLKKFIAVLQNMRFDCLVIDEHHFIKNPKAIRSKLAKAIAYRIKYLVMLSGTPMLNRPEELYNGLNLLDGKAWPSWLEFVKRYCGAYRGRWGWDTSGATNIPELKERISPYFLRRVKGEVLKELPPKNYITVPVELDASHEKLYNEAEKSLARYLRDHKDKTTEEIRKSLAAEKIVKLNALRQIVTSGKTSTAEELIDQLIENQEKVIVFSCFNEPLEKLKEKYGAKAVLLTGKTPIEERGRIVEDFQYGSDIRVFLGGLQAAGTGITLTAASNVIFIDYFYVPAIMIQAQDRAHRIGQEAESVNIYQLHAKDTLIDEWLASLLEEKRALINQLIEKEAPEKQETSTMEFIFNKLEEKYV